MQCVTHLVIRKLVLDFTLVSWHVVCHMHVLELQAKLWQLCASTLLLASLPKLLAWQLFLQQNAWCCPEN